MLVAPGKGERRKVPFYFKRARVDFDVVFLRHRLYLCVPSILDNTKLWSCSLHSNKNAIKRGVATLSLCNMQQTMLKLGRGVRRAFINATAFMSKFYTLPCPSFNF
ncbi:hypothetical protein IscW_ISCW023089 [Ixodes scapularis]|uniref:Uncharacterized protein n=1 Tax=Ixodes scapularis TaxID=6945 RepID=B7QM01_IXOSC|nr:hypothetical protein IscW_ISCW023089 [Ixodes scapularis]|eukprot:XP_002416206.1 hypothetical protein IscW_ISCW023089 [Ixodes scapularis]